MRVFLRFLDQKVIFEHFFAPIFDNCFCRRLVDLALRCFFNQSSFDMCWCSLKTLRKILVSLVLPKRDDKFYFNSHLSLRRKRTAGRYSILILLDDLADATSQKLGVLVRS